MLMQYLSYSNVQSHGFIADITDIAFTTKNQEHRTIFADTE